MFSHKDLPLEAETLEYGWLIELTVGDLRVITELYMLLYYYVSCCLSNPFKNMNKNLKMCC